MSNGPALRFQWDKIQWVALKDVRWTGPDVVDLVTRVEELAAQELHSATPNLRQKLRLVHNGKETT